MKTLFLSLPLVALLLIACGGGGDIHQWEKNKITASYQEGAIAEPAAAGCPSTAEIHIDASGSMKPYFGADVAGNLIATISKIWNLNTSGTSIYFQDYPQSYNNDKISTIITDIKHQPSTVASVFYDFFGKQADKIDTTNTLVYLVTDGIMSEGDGRGGFGNMNLSLEQLKGRVTASLQGHKNLAAAILRYEGGYHGDYWNQNNQRITAKQCPLLKDDAITRPYYVIVLGRKDTVRWLLTLPAEELNNPKGQLFMGVHDLAGHGKATLSCPDGVEPKEMSLEVPAEPITLVLDLPSCLKDIDATQVRVCNGSKDLSVVQVEKTVVANGSAKLTAVVPDTIYINSNTEGVCTISFVAENSIPSVWLDAWDCADDSAGPDLSSTFSLRYLVQGMWTALEGDTPLLHCDFIYNINN